MSAVPSLPHSAPAPFPDPPSSLREVQQQHAVMVKTGHSHSSFAASRLLYAAATASPEAPLPYCRSIFDRIPKPNSFTWNAMILAYAVSFQPLLAVFLLVDMLIHGYPVLPDRFTFPLVLKVCATMGAGEEARQIHARVVKTRFCLDMFVTNTLVHAYAAAGREAEASTLFYRMAERDAVSWNVMIRSYTERGMMEKARGLFDEMSTAARNIETWNFMVTGYTSLRMLDSARDLFDEMPVRDVVSWNAMMAGYARDDRFDDVLVLFREMLRLSDVKPDSRTLVTVLSACAHLGSLSQGEWVHAYMDRNGMEAVEDDRFLRAALVDMYAKCGNIDKAVSVFEGDGLRLPNDASAWNSMIGGLGSHGRERDALKLFEEMLARGIELNEVTFVNVLAACSQGGLVEEGKKVFNGLLAGANIHGIKPNVMHYGCMVDLLARAGELEEAERVISTYVQSVDELQGAGSASASVLWESLLMSCRRHRNVELAERVALKLEDIACPDHQGSYPWVQLSNVYASAGRWEDVDAVRAAMRERAVRKQPGCSAIEVDGMVHEFFSGEHHT